MTRTDLSAASAYRRTAPVLAAAGFICATLAACSGTSTKSVAATGATQKPPPSAVASTAASTTESTQTEPAVAASSEEPTPTDAVGSPAPSYTPVAADVAAGKKPWGHPCALLTQGELADTLGVPFSVGAEISLPSGGFCTYGSTDQLTHVEYQVSTWDVIVPAARELGTTYSAINGVGDEAFSVTQDQSVAVLAVRRGTAGFYVTLSGQQFFAMSDFGLAKEGALAALMVRRM